MLPSDSHSVGYVSFAPQNNLQRRLQAKQPGTDAGGTATVAAATTATAQPPPSTTAAATAAMRRGQETDTA